MRLVKARMIKVIEDWNPENSTAELNKQLQDTIDEFNSLGLNVVIEKVYSELPKSGQSSSAISRDYILVAGYAND